jgi:hypothetical protein
LCSKNQLSFPPTVEVLYDKLSKFLIDVNPEPMFNGLLTTHYQKLSQKSRDSVDSIEKKCKNLEVLLKRDYSYEKNQFSMIIDWDSCFKYENFDKMAENVGGYLPFAFEEIVNAFGLLRYKHWYFKKNPNKFIEIINGVKLIHEESYKIIFSSVSKNIHENNMKKTIVTMEIDENKIINVKYNFGNLGSPYDSNKYYELIDYAVEYEEFYYFTNLTNKLYREFDFFSRDVMMTTYKNSFEKIEFYIKKMCDGLEVNFKIDWDSIIKDSEKLNTCQINLNKIMIYQATYQAFDSYNEYNLYSEGIQFIEKKRKITITSCIVIINRNIIC